MPLTTPTHIIDDLKWADSRKFLLNLTHGIGTTLPLNICPFLKAEKRMSTDVSKPKNFDEALACEEQACALLKEVVKANKQLKVVQAASEGIRGNIEVQETMSKLQGRGDILWHYHSEIF